MSKRRRRIPDQPVNHDRWLISYADFVTLLFAFFVVMYAISAVSENKYREFSKSLEKAFLEKKRQLGETSGPGAASPGNRQWQKTSEQLASVVDSLIADKLVTVSRSRNLIELQINSELLFVSGSADLSKSSLPVLKKVAEILRPLPNAIYIEGHTDNLPIDTPKFPSNWDLSAARATTVVREFVNNGIDPPRLAAIGYGEFHPIADNKIEEGRFKNRRVVVAIMSQDYARHHRLDEMAMGEVLPSSDAAN